MDNPVDATDDAAAMANNGNSIDTAEAYHASQVEEFHRIRKMCKFFRKRDSLDHQVGEMIEALSDKPPTLESTDFVNADVTDMSNALPAVESILIPSFFERTTLGFRLLRRSLDLHLVNTIDEDATLSVEVPDADREYPRILEHIWFLLFIGAAATQISACLKEYRMNRMPQKGIRSSLAHEKSSYIPTKNLFHNAVPLDLRHDSSTNRAAVQNGRNEYSKAPGYTPNTSATAHNDARSAFRQDRQQFHPTQRPAHQRQSLASDQP